MMKRIAAALAAFLIDSYAQRREPDFIIGGRANPYNRRWYFVPKNRLFNVYLHNFKRSDDDRALHDHPWSNVSLILRGRYIEHTRVDAWTTMERYFFPGAVRVRLRGSLAHRIELDAGECWTLFITGPKYREWGFHCPKGWVHWRVFTSASDKGTIGKGCGE